MSAGVVQYFEKAPPLAALAAAKLGGLKINAEANPKFTKDSPPILVFTDGYVFYPFYSH